MTNDERKALIEGAAKAILARSWGLGTMESARADAEIAFAVFEQAHTPPEDKTDLAAFEKIAGVLYRDKADEIAALRRGEQAHPSTDDEREALAQLIPLGFRAQDGVRNVFDAADRILAAGFRRPVQGSGNSAQNSDHERELLAEADALVEQWDREGSWTPDSPVGLVMRLADAIRRPVQGEPPATDARGKYTDAQVLYMICLALEEGIEGVKRIDLDDLLLKMISEHWGTADEDTSPAEAEAAFAQLERHIPDHLRRPVQGEPSGRMIDTYSHDDLRAAFGLQGEPTEHYHLWTENHPCREGAECRVGQGEPSGMTVPLRDGNNTVNPGAQGEPSDAQVLAALNAQWRTEREQAKFPKREPAPDLSFFGDQTVERMRAALRAAFQEGENR